MITAKITSKGQVTIPKAIRELLGLREGEELGFQPHDDTVVLCKVVSHSPFEKWAGKLTHLKGARSDELIGELRGHDNRH